MKCVCPSGGDRTCPDNCLLSVWHKLPLDDRKIRRKPIAEQLYKQGYTMEVIATQLGVSINTIHHDLRNFSTIEKSKPAKTTTNPKGAGRPKGSKGKRKPRPKQTDSKEEQIVALADQGLTSTEIAVEVGAEGRAVRHTLERERIRRETQPEIDPASLSLTAQQKFDIAVRQHQRKLDLTFEQRVRDEVKRRIDEIILPHWKEQIEQAKQLYERRRALMDKETFNTIRRALHPDSRQSISDKKLGEAFDTFMGLEKYLLNEKDSPTTFGALPSSLAEWDKMRAAAKTARKGRKNGLARR